MRTAVVSAALAVVLIILLIVGNTAEFGPNPYIVYGLANGAIFGLLALGLVLVYKGTRVFNFMQAEFGTLAAYLMYLGVAPDRLGLPYGVSMLLALAGILLIGLAIERVLIRPLLDAPRITVLVATIAAGLLAIGIEILVFRIDPQQYDPIYQGGWRGIDVFGATIEPQRLIGMGVLLAIGVVLAYFFSRTDTGLAVLATSQDAFATRVVGVGVERMSRFIWGSAALIGGIAGILYVPIAGAVLPGVMTSNLLIPAFTGAVIGGMTSLPGAFVGGTVVGVVQQLGIWAAGFFKVGEFPNQKVIGDVIPGLEQVAILLVLLIVLMVRPAGLLGRET